MRCDPPLFVSSADRRQEGNLILVTQGRAGSRVLLVDGKCNCGQEILEPRDRSLVVGQQVGEACTLRKRQGVVAAADQVTQGAEEQHSNLHG